MKLQSSQELTNLVQFTLSYPIFWIHILILLLHLCLGHQTGLFPWGFWTTILYAFLIIPMCASAPSTSSYLILLLIIQQYIIHNIVNSLLYGKYEEWNVLVTVRSIKKTQRNTISHCFYNFLAFYAFPFSGLKSTHFSALVLVWVFSWVTEQIDVWMI